MLNMQEPVTHNKPGRLGCISSDDLGVTDLHDCIASGTVWVF